MTIRHEKAQPEMAGLSFFANGSALYAYHLTQGVQHFHQFALRVHNGINVLVGHRNFIDDRRILAALDVDGGANLVFDGKQAFCLGATHGAAGAVAAGAE